MTKSKTVHKKIKKWTYIFLIKGIY